MIPATPTSPFLDMLSRSRTAPIEELAPGNVLVVAPHADDETLGCGAAIVAARRAGRRVGVALLTDGCASHPNSRTHPHARLRALRRREFDRAVRLLDARIETTALDLPDAGLPDDADTHETIARALLPFARRIGAGTIWTTWEGDPHADHVLAAKAARLAARRLRVPLASYLVWGRFSHARAMPHQGDVRRFRDRTGEMRKRRAAGCYRSQLTPLIRDDPEGFVMPPAYTRHFLHAPEAFAVERS